MSDVATELQNALEDAGYEVEDTSENRGQVRATLRTTDAPAAELKALAEDAVGDALLGVDVTTERAAGDAVGTVVSVRHR